MDDYYPDPDEEFELLHADEMEVLNEFDEEDYEPPDTRIPSKSKKSLDFTSPGHKESNAESTCLAASLVDESHITVSCPLQIDNAVHETNNENDENVTSDTELTSAERGSVSHQEITSAKRKVVDLFGDIDDIDFSEDFDKVLNKRLKTGLEKKVEENLSEEQRMDITIQKILAARQQDKNDNFPMYKQNKKVRIQKELEITRRVPTYQFISLALPYGDKVYLRFLTEDLFNAEVEAVSRETKLGGLLAVPFKNIQEEAALLLQKKMDAAEQELINAQTNIVDTSTEVTEDALWVEKYRPKRYLDLLSDEGTNKSLLKWLKLWDKVVFNKENKIKIKQKYEEKGKFGGKFKKKAPENELDDELDEMGRPKFKIALLCGPPGLGKTTLAHILAQHAGYNVVEVNASDDRSPEMFKTQLLAATQMRAVMGKDPRPNCLVLDEIDGAPQASIDVLVKFATAKEPLKGKGGKKKKSDLNGILKRPIICICNDVYVPALRPLRQAAYILNFPPTCSYRLAQRLCEISRMQNLKTDLGAMMALGEKTNNDIRACLALLHCLQSKSGNTIRLAQVNNAAVGTKDIQKGLFTVWQEIFQIKNPNRWKSVLHTVQVCGDYDRLAQGVYENYLTIKLKGSSLKLISEGMDWFVHYDILSTSIHATQNYTVYSYLPYPFLKWHFLFAGRLWPKILFPSLGFEITSRSTKNHGILDEMLQGMLPNVRPYQRRETLLLDVLALLLEVIVPNLRPVNVQLYSDQEKADLNKVVNIMLDYNLCYTQERSQDGNYIFKLDPNIEDVAKFPGWKPQRILVYAGRQQVQRAIDLERVRRLENKMKLCTNSANVVANKPATINKADAVVESSVVNLPEKKEDSPKMLPNHLQKLAPKALKRPSETVCRDFFGRVIEKQSIVGDGGPVPGKDIWFRFKEGYNNAVRLRVNMSDLY